MQRANVLVKQGSFDDAQKDYRFIVCLLFFFWLIVYLFIFLN